MTDELLYQVDENDNVIGRVWKSEAHKNPDLIHRIIAVVIFNDKNEVLLQQRSLDREYKPGEWKLSVYGHVGFGENMEDSVKREVFEELGVKVKPIFYKKEYQKSSSKAKFLWIYYSLVKGRPKLNLDYKEVDNAKWISVDNLDEFAQGKTGFIKSYEIITEIAKKLKII